MAEHRVGDAAAPWRLPHHPAAPARARVGRAARHGTPEEILAEVQRTAIGGQPLDDLPQPRGARGGRPRHARPHRARGPDVPLGRRPRAHPPRVRPLRCKVREHRRRRSPTRSSTTCGATGFVTDVSHVALHGTCSGLQRTGTRRRGWRTGSYAWGKDRGSSSGLTVVVMTTAASPLLDLPGACPAPEGIARLRRRRGTTATRTASSACLACAARAGSTSRTAVS